MEVSIRELQESAQALRRISDNPKVQTKLYFKLVNAWRDVLYALQPVEEKLIAITNDHTTIVGDGKDALQIYKSATDRIEHDKSMREIGATMVDLPRVKEQIPYSLLRENDNAAKDDSAKLNITPVELVSLAWLVDFEAEAGAE